MPTTSVQPQQGTPYVRSAAVLAFLIHGLPQPQGSTKFVGMRRNGSAVLTSDNPKLKDWRKDVIRVMRWAINEAPAPAGGFPLVGPVAIDMCFTVAKPKSAPKTRRTYPITRPDTDKLVRGILDAGTYAGLFGDDSQVVDEHGWKVYPGETPRALSMPGLHCVVYQIDPPTPGEQTTLL